MTSAKKITCKTTSEKPEDLIASFRNSYNPRIAVTVDMISTGTDIKPLECLIFMRNVKSRVYFEQMKGRGTRVISPTDLKAVTPDTSHKTHFVIVDAVGVCENDKTDSHPLERKRTVPFDKLIMSVALGNRDGDTLTSLAGRLARLEREIDEKDQKEIEQAGDGKTLKQIINNLLDTVDPDKKIEKAKAIFGTEAPTEEQVKNEADELAKIACLPFDNPQFRNTLIEIKKRNEQIIDTVSKDNVMFAGFDEQAKEKARTIIDTFKKFIEVNKDELTALQIIYNKPFPKRQITYEQIRALADAIKKPPYYLTPELLWQAYEKLEKSKVKGAGPQKLLTNIISLIRFAVGETETLEPFPNRVNHRFETWRAQQEHLGRNFTPEQVVEWLTMIKDHIATSLSIGMGDFEYAPFYEKGGPVKVYQLFGSELNSILKDGIGFGSTEFHVIRLHESFLKKFFFFFLIREDLRRDAQRNMTGSAGQLRVPSNYMKQIPIPLPPLPEQHQIVEEIERRFSVADEVEKVVEQSLRQAARMRQSILKKAFEGKLAPQDPNDEPAEKLLERLREKKVKVESNKKFCQKRLKGEKRDRKIPEKL